MKTWQSIHSANMQGRLGLVLYVIPNFPSPESYKLSIQRLVRLPFVSAIEMTVPVQNGFSDHANETIVQSHKQAASHKQTWRDVIGDLPIEKPLICVLYKETSDSVGFEIFVSEARSKLDGILLEWNEKDESPYRIASDRFGVEFIACVGPWMNDWEIEKAIRYTPAKPVIYLMSAPMTGAKLFNGEDLSKTVATVKKLRPHSKIAAGFGVKTPDDVRRLAEVRGLDAVIIGTSFLEKMGEGLEAMTSYLSSMEGALTRE